MSPKSIKKRFFSSNKRPGTEYYVIESNAPGPVVMITAGIHGTEIAGVEVAEKCRELTLRKGTLIVVPLVNRNAYQKGIRGKPDLNRTFPRFSKDLPRHTISRQIFRLVKHYKPKWCIDLHEADGLYRVNHKKWGQTIVIYPNERTKRVATKVVFKVNQNIARRSHKFSVRSVVLPGSFRTAVARVLRSNAVTLETSMQQPKRVRVQYQTDIVQLFLKQIGII